MLGGAAALLLSTLAKQGVRPAASGAEAQVQVEIRHWFGEEPLRFDDVNLRNTAGNTLSISRLAYLVSDAALVREDGTQTAPNPEAAYLNPAENRTGFALKHAAPGRYAGITFRIGLSPAANHADPSRYPAGHALNPLTNGLHWNWQGGSVFLALEGRYEEPGGRLGGYAYHLGTDRMLMRVTIHHAFEIRANSLLRLNFDAARIFDAANKIAIQGRGGDSTHSAAGDALAEKLGANVERAFTFAEIAPAARAAEPETVAQSPAPPGTTPWALTIPDSFPQPGSAAG